jgi:hypothetical protein
MKKPIYVVIGAALTMVGAILLLSQTGIISFNLPMSVKMAVASGQTLGLTLTTDVKSYPYPLATVGKGYTYKWKVELKNTGTATWDGGWVTVRVGINGASVVSVNCQTNPASCDVPVAGNFYVERCSSGTDVEACRVDLSSSGWNLLQSDDGVNWVSPSGGCSKRVCSVASSGPIAPGQSMIKYFKLTVPTTASEGNYPLITNGMASVSGTYAIASKSDNLSVGTISGELIVSLIGALMLIGGVAAIVFGMI